MVRKTKSPELHPEVQKTRELYNNLASNHRVWADAFQEDQEFRNGIQWTDPEKDDLDRMGLQPIVNNIVYSAVEQAIAFLTANKPRFQATARENSDTKTAGAISDLLSWIWDISDGSVNFKHVADDYYVGGMGVWAVYHDQDADEGRGEAKITSLDPRTVYITEDAKDRYARDASSIFIRSVMSESQLRAILPNADTVLAEAVDTVESLRPVQGGYSKEKVSEAAVKEKKYIVFDRYTRIMKSRFNISDPPLVMDTTVENLDEFKKKPALVEADPNGELRYVIREEDIAQLVQILGDTVLQQGGQYHFVVMPMDDSGMPIPRPGPENPEEDAAAGYETVPGSTVTVTAVNMGQLIDSQYLTVREIRKQRIQRVYSVGDVLVTDEILELSNYPIVPVMNGWSRDPYPKGEVRQVKLLQKFINRARALFIAHAANAASLKVFMPRGAADAAKVKEELQRVGISVVEYNAEIGEVKFGQPVPLPVELYQLEERGVAAIRDTLGIYPFQGGDPKDAPLTFKGTILMDEMGQRRIKEKLSDMEEGLNQVARVILELVPRIYTKPKVIRLIRPNNIGKETKINYPIYSDVSDKIVDIVNNITQYSYDIVIVSGSTLPSNRWARFEYYMTLFERGVIDRTELLMQTEVVDTEKVLERMSEIMQLQQQLSVAMEEIKKLRGDLQTAERESMHDRKRVEVEKFKTDLHGMKQKAAATAQVFEARLGDELTNAKVMVAGASREAIKSYRGKSKSK